MRRGLLIVAGNPECTPTTISLAAGGFVECGVYVEGVDPQKDVASIEYGFGDGSPPSEYWAHTYTAPGTYTLTVTVVATDRQRATATTKLIVTA